MAEVVRFKFQWNWVTTDLLEKFKDNNLAKVNCLKLQTQEKPPLMFSLAYNLPRTSKIVRKNNGIFRPDKLHWKKNVETTWIFQPAKLHRCKYVETTWIFQTSKLHLKRYMDTTWIFRPLKLHRKSTGKLRGNSSKFGLWHINIISTSNQPGLNVVCPLGWHINLEQDQDSKIRLFNKRAISSKKYSEFI